MKHDTTLRSAVIALGAVLFVFVGASLILHGYVGWGGFVLVAASLALWSA